MASERNRTEEKKTYTVGEIAEMLGISDKVAYTLVKSGQFKYVRVGRAIRVSESACKSFVTRQDMNVWTSIRSAISPRSTNSN